jgi:membrane associated rhomboid family serine protease
MQEQNFLEYIRNGYRRSGVLGKLIAISILVSLLFGILLIVENLFLVDNLKDSVKYWFAAPGNPERLGHKPWTIITQLFTHGNFGHLAFNMLALYFIGRMFVQFFGEKRLVSTYLLGGIFGYIIHVSAFFIFPAYWMKEAGPIVGASGAVFALFAAVVVYRPQLKVSLFLIPIQIPLFLIFGLYILFNLQGLMIPENELVENQSNTAYFAHLGGALFGALSVMNVQSPKNFMNRLDKWLTKLKKFKFSFKRKPKMKVYKSDARTMTDDDYNSSRKNHQDRVDAILDKISKKGYEGLTKEEKEILFNESKRK